MKIEIKNSSVHGRGVFCTDDISNGEIIETCRVIALSERDTKVIDDTILYDYYFSWKENGSAICLGNGILYNHSVEPNAKYVKDLENGKIIFVAVRNIKRGEEIFVNYNGTQSKDKVWFETRV